MPRRILVVEDEPDLVAVFRTLCDPTRYEVVFAGSLATARRVWSQDRHPDLVVLDAGLADGSGVDFAREIKAGQPDLPVLLVTADASQLDASGADMAIWKPFEPEHVQDAVSRLLGEAVGPGGQPGEPARPEGEPGHRPERRPVRRRIDLILVPVDFSAGSEAAVACALWLAGRLGARVRLLHVTEGLSRAAEGAAPDVWAALVAAHEEVREQARRELDGIATRLAREAGAPEGTQPETAVVGADDSTAERIIRAAREAGADLVVMGTHGRSGLRRLALGSVAEQVVRRADCPVLTVRSRPAPETAAAEA